MAGYNFNILTNKSKKDNFFVYFYVFYALWSFLYGFIPIEGHPIGELMNALHGELLISLLVLLVAIVEFNGGGMSRSAVDKKSAVVFLGCYFFYTINTFLSFSLNIVGLFQVVVSLITMASFFLIRDDLKVRILNGLIYTMSCLFFLSIVEYLLFIITGNRIIIREGLTYQEQAFEQTLFNFMNFSQDLQFLLAGFYRFQSLAVEPGNVGTFSALMLFATYGCKKYRIPYIIFFIAGVLSFSLAFYLLAAIQLIFIGGRRNWSVVLGVVLIIAAGYYYLGDAFTYLISDRISGDSADNRSSYALEMAFKRAWEDGSLWFGRDSGSVSDNIDGAGVKLSIYFHGIIGVAILVSAYVFIYISKVKQLHLKNKLMLWVFFLAFWASYYQRDFIERAEFRIVYFTMPIFFIYKELVNKQAAVESKPKKKK